MLHYRLVSYELSGPDMNLTDVKDVGYVIVSNMHRSYVCFNSLVTQNYDFPNNLEDYVHRIGRTGVHSLNLHLCLLFAY